MTSPKLEQLYDELRQVDAGTHPRYLKRLRQIEDLCQEQREREDIAHEVRRTFECLLVQYPSDSLVLE